jgi:hypothetical protein
MDAKIIPFPAPEPTAAPDPVAERAAFFFDLEMAELTATIPQADPAEPKQVY